MTITTLEVEQFRNLKNVTLNFSERMNAIAGQNGTSKTSILGLIGHIFTYSKEYKTLSWWGFYTEFSEIFKFSYPEFDKAGDHRWSTKFKDSEESISAVSYDRTESNKKDGIRIRVGKSLKWGGKIHFPVVYLGMWRLFPLTLEGKINSTEMLLDDEEIQEFQKLHN